VRKRPLGKTGLEVSELALGTWGVSGDGYGAVVEAEAERVIERAVALGITLFDTADVYGGGEMERRLGKLLKQPSTTASRDQPAAAGPTAVPAPAVGTVVPARPGIPRPPLRPPPPTVPRRPDAIPGAPRPGTDAKPGGNSSGSAAAGPGTGAGAATGMRAGTASASATGAGTAAAAGAGSAAGAAAETSPALESPPSCVVTKIGTDLEEGRKRFDAKYLRGAIERCQERLGRERLDVVLLHNPTLSGLSAGEAVDLLKELRTKGTVRAWGVSTGSVEVARSAIERGAEVLELAYNVFAARDLHELAAEISAAGTGVLARSILAHGLLAGQWSADREFYAGDHRVERWQPAELKRRIAQLDALRPLVTGSVHSLRALAVRFALANHLVSSVVLGPRTVAQLEQLVRDAGAGPPYLRDTALADLTNRLKAVGVRVS
jgi:aryl-alcohol dehydrogenase-like predicted oxidoreductase